jgi:hypothetical protein
LTAIHEATVIWKQRRGWAQEPLSFAEERGLYAPIKTAHESYAAYAGPLEAELRELRHKSWLLRLVDRAQLLVEKPIGRVRDALWRRGAEDTFY